MYFKVGGDLNCILTGLQNRIGLEMICTIIYVRFATGWFSSCWIALSPAARSATAMCTSIRRRRRSQRLFNEKRKWKDKTMCENNAKGFNDNLGCRMPHEAKCICGDCTERFLNDIPRVMTIKEVEEWLDTPHKQQNPVFVEYKNKPEENGWIVYESGRRFLAIAADGVGRFWTKKPSEELAAKTPWNIKKKNMPDSAINVYLYDLSARLQEKVRQAFGDFFDFDNTPVAVITPMPAHAPSVREIVSRLDGLIATTSAKFTASSLERYRLDVVNMKAAKTLIVSCYNLNVPCDTAVPSNVITDKKGLAHVMVIAELAHEQDNPVDRKVVAVVAKLLKKAYGLQEKE